MKKAILMTRFGINTVVSSSFEKIEAGMKICDSIPEQFLGGSKGKLVFYRELLFQLRKEEAFFTSSPSYQEEFPERWSVFLEGCLMLTCLHTHLFKDEIQTLDIYA